MPNPRTEERAGQVLEILLAAGKPLSRLEIVWRYSLQFISDAERAAGRTANETLVQPAIDLLVERGLVTTHRGISESKRFWTSRPNKDGRRTTARGSMKYACLLYTVVGRADE